MLCYKRRFFPQARVSQVCLAEIRQLLLDMFKQWGLPLAVRSDNGAPFGVPTRDVIPIMSLWLLAWGVRPIINRPRRPQDNAKVERNQGTVARWAEVHNCPDIQTLQARLDEAAELQRNHYPVAKLGKAARSDVFAALTQIKRPFENAIFDEHRAYQHLAKAVYPRKVSSGGTISIYAKSFQVGLKYQNKIVYVKFDPSAIHWIVLNEHQSILKIIPDTRFSKENLFNLSICQ